MKSLAMLPVLLATLLAAQDGGSIEGRVTNPVSGYGIPGVTVRINGGVGKILPTTTEASGTFRVAGLANGNYRLSFEKPGFDPSDGMPWDGISATVLGADTVKIEAHLTPRAIVRGHVLDPDGKPVAHVPVRIIPSSDDDSVTDDGGSFAFADLRAGSYILLADPVLKPPDDTGERIEVVSTYYPNDAERSQAQRILLRGGPEPGEYNIRLQRSPVFRVHGVVLDDAGKPAPNAKVTLLASAGRRIGSYGFGRNTEGDYAMVAIGDSLFPEAHAVTTTNGDFEFTSVRPGQWRLQAQSAPLEAVEDRDIVSAAGRPVEVSSHDVNGLEIRLAPPFNLQVSTDWGGQEGYPGLLPFDLVTLDGQPTPAGFLKSPPRFDEMVPGRYRVQPRGVNPPGLYLTSVTMGGREVLGQEIELIDGTIPLRATFKTGVGSLRGSVQKGDGATAVLVPKALVRDANATGTILTVPCGSSGTFEIHNLAPGDYYVIAFDHPPNVRSPQSILSAMVPNATSVRLEEGSSASVELRVNRWMW